ncbi:MAG TPA: arsenate reductase ArsC [Deltaproteobacteria bacterium]|nr:arsenate reductase ArsC [Deltaproteobacteria bacterium]
MLKPNVLFLCTGNSARSQMAEAFARHYAGDALEAYSAGLEPKGLHPMTIKVMEEIGIDMRAHTSKPLSDFLGKIHFSYLITVCGQADKNCPAVFPGMGRRLHWGFEDPAAATGSEEERLQKFREIRDQIQERVRTWLHELGIPIRNGG